MNEFVSTKWLFKNINKNNKNLVVLDCSWFLPSENKNPKEFYIKKHIKSSYFFDIEEISDKKNRIPHMLPDLKFFNKKIQNFNIHKNTKIVTYGSKNMMGPARVWWIFKYFNFNQIYVLNGGLSKWIREKKPITNKRSFEKKSTYDFKIDNTWLTKKETILNNLVNDKQLIFDARNENRYKGIEKEPRSGLRSGHIPKSKNIYWKNLTKKGEEKINNNFIKKEFNKYKFKNKKIVLTCGSGISACVLSLFLMHTLGIKGSVYDGSWAEWGSIKELPIKNEQI